MATDYDSMTTDELKARLRAMDQQAITICEVFESNKLVCGGANIVSNLHLLFRTFEETSRKAKGLETELTELVEAIGERDDLRQAVQKARVALKRRIW